MGDETWASIQLVMSKRESFREKLKRRKAERDTILSVAGSSAGSSPVPSATGKLLLSDCYPNAICHSYHQITCFLSK